MARYIAKRILYMIPVLLGVTLLVFFIMHLAPGNVAGMILGENATPEQIAALEHELLLGSLADGAEIRGGIPFVNITANRADPLFHVFFLLIHHFIYLISGYPEVLISNDYHF